MAKQQYTITFNGTDEQNIQAINKISRFVKENFNVTSGGVDADGCVDNVEFASTGCASQAA